MSRRGTESQTARNRHGATRIRGEDSKVNPSGAELKVRCSRIARLRENPAAGCKWRSQNHPGDRVTGLGFERSAMLMFTATRYPLSPVQSTGEMP